jgi:hypothetical protein|tara:strand:+ start:93 stop:521 length:429 start_codon:yes stop_codon:yes gene_type:complete
MIKYKLNCKDCGNIFDSWFASSKEFEKLKKVKLINCSICNSFKIEKSIMSPQIASNLKSNKKEATSLKIKQVKAKIKEFQNYIEKNFENVGRNFTYEARSLHYGKKKSKKGIYGNASTKEIEELKEEGIETTSIPWVKDKEN